jgi:hypothetical protein
VPTGHEVLPEKVEVGVRNRFAFGTRYIGFRINVKLVIPIDRDETPARNKKKGGLRAAAAQTNVFCDLTNHRYPNMFR